MATTEYPGLDRYSFVSKESAASVVPSPASLCSRCQSLDVPSFFLEEKESKQCLNTIDMIEEGASSCGFCCLVLAALRAESPEAVSSERLILPRTGIAPVNVYLRSAIAGQYTDHKVMDGCISDNSDNSSVSEKGSKHVSSSPSGQTVRCITVFVDRGSAEARLDPQNIKRGTIRLLADDAYLLGQQPLYHGRMIGRQLSRELLWEWVKACNFHHQRCKDIRFQWDDERFTSTRSLTLINPTTMSLIKPRPLQSKKYLALSYVWGAQQKLQLTKANRHEMFQKEALSRNWEQIPAVIQDAINVVKDISLLYYAEKKEELYLWVDQLCIVQDDHSDKTIMLDQMGYIYSDAIATIMAINGQHSNVKLSRWDMRGTDSPPRTLTDDRAHDVAGDQAYTQRTSRTSTSKKQMIRNINGLRLVAALPAINKAIEECKWATRAWTMQENELSHCAILFGQDQVYFRCRELTLQEDRVAEVSPSALQANRYAESFTSVHLHRLKHGNRGEWPETWKKYTTVVENYMTRNMTFPTDILNAFRGVAQVLHTLTQWNMPNGLPDDVLDYALLWRPHGEIRRRFTSDRADTGDQQVLQLPSYAWAAWQGRISYDPCNTHLHSLIERFEKPSGSKLVHIPRFSQRDDSTDLHIDRGLSNVEPWAPADATLLEYGARAYRFADPIVRSILFKTHLVNRSTSMADQDGLIVLHFRTNLLPVSVSAALYLGSQKYVHLLNRDSRVIGYAWHVPPLDALPPNQQHLDAIILSKSKVDERVTAEWMRLTGMNGSQSMEEWCLVNVMLVTRKTLGENVERITIGKIHEDFIEEGTKSLVRLV